MKPRLFSNNREFRQINPEVTTKEWDSEKLMEWAHDLKGRLSEFEHDSVQTGLSQAREQLLAEMGRFMYIFETTNGSLYVTTRDGATLRIKKQEDGSLSLNPVFRKVLFIDPLSEGGSKEFAKKMQLIDKLKSGEWAETYLEPREGLIPVEIVNADKGQCLIEDEGNRVRIFDEDNSEIEFDYHFGHEIAKVKYRPGENAEIDNLENGFRDEKAA